MNCIFRPLEKESLWALKAPFGEYLPGETCVSAVAVHLCSLSFHRNLLRTSACCDLCRMPPCHSDVKVFSSSVVGLFSLPPPPSKESCVQGSGLVSEAGSCCAAVVVAETPLAQYSRSNCVHPYLNVSIRACKTSISKQCLV